MTEKSTAFSESSIRSAGESLEQYHIEVYPTLESTNLTARALAEAGAPSGTVVFADAQTRGRGRLGRSFYSPAGSSIYMTLLLRPRFLPEEASSVTTFAAVAVARAIERVTGLHASLKWVNDVWIGNRKVCGILAESALSPAGTGLSYVLLGIGINVNRDGFPEELSGIATSLLLECGRTVDRSRLAAVLLSELSPLLSGDAPRGYMDEYRARNLVLGREITVVTGDRSYVAVGKRIEENGNLTVICSDGCEKSICAGEVSIRL
ncbi:MAG: biotin--[Clostridia bacterium]|nr:biotin--[acetyl-CoA-carboxylase] ligase [Clostridia bacterium]